MHDTERIRVDFGKSLLTLCLAGEKPRGIESTVPDLTLHYRHVQDKHRHLGCMRAAC